MSRRTTLSALPLIAAVLVLPGVCGCNAMNDNPISKDQMHSIRQKEAAGRATFNPTSKPPGPGG